jgi:shikimate dehydrogenase
MTRAAPRHAAVLGSPVAHSLSPVLHHAAYQELGLDWEYEAIECDEARLRGLLAGLDAAFVGCSLTMPLKRAVLPLLHDVSDVAAAVGAVNTITAVSADGDGPGGRAWSGDNTDAPGIVAALRTVLSGRLDSVAILGAGGTAAAALAAVTSLGLGEASVVVRDASRAGDLLAAADRLGVRVRLVDWPGVAALERSQLVISTVPAGAGDVVAERWSPRPDQRVFDVVYDPWPTPLAVRVAEGGALVVGGLELLVQQAALQVQRWSGRPGPVDVMRAAGEAALRARSRG